jgi:hypothetical protein
MISSAARVLFPSRRARPPVNVDIDKSRRCADACVELAHATRQIDFPSLPDGGNLAPQYEHYGIGNFFEGGKCSIRVNDNRLHIKNGIILLEMQCHWESR